jgi:rhamnogalacturonyl hydrolase YesR
MISSSRSDDHPDDHSSLKTQSDTLKKPQKTQIELWHHILNKTQVTSYNQKSKTQEYSSTVKNTSRMPQEYLRNDEYKEVPLLA